MLSNVVCQETVFGSCSCVLLTLRVFCELAEATERVTCEKHIFSVDKQ